MKRKGIRAPGGPWGTILRLLESANTQVFLGIWIGLAAIIGFVSEAGMHPMEHLGLRLPLVLLPFCVLARGLIKGKRTLLISGLWTLGFLLAVLSSWQPAGVGVAEVSNRGPVERYQRAFRGRYVDSYLGGAMNIEQKADGAVLRLGRPGQKPESTPLPADGREQLLGPWAVHLHGQVDADGPPQTAELLLTPRAGGDPIRLTAPIGVAVPIPNQGQETAAGKDAPQVLVRRILEDFRKSLGPAAQIEVRWATGVETAWHFLDAPGLDERHGGSPWKLAVSSLVSGRTQQIGVRPPTWPMGAGIGWGVMALALLLGAFTHREAA